MPPSTIPSTSSAISSPGRRFGSSDQKRRRNGAARPTRHDASSRPRILTKTPQLDSAPGDVAGPGAATRSEAPLQARCGNCHAPSDRGCNGRRGSERDRLAASYGSRRLLGNLEEKARADSRFGQRGAWPGLSATVSTRAGTEIDSEGKRDVSYRKRSATWPMFGK